MKVKDLIEILSLCDQELDVVLSGYEGGLTDTVKVYGATVVCNVNKQWYHGEHEVDDDYYRENEDTASLPRKKVICIARQ